MAITTIRSLRGVVLDGSTPASCHPSSQTLRVAQATDLRVELAVVGEDGEAYDLTGLLVLLTVRAALGDAEPVFAREGVLVSATGGTARFTVLADELDLPAADYVHDVVLTTSGGELRAQLVPTSAFRVAAAVSQPDDTTSLPAATNTYRVLFSNRGAYSGATAYSVWDLVTYQGETFIALVATTGTAPTPGATSATWQLVAARGLGVATISSAVPGVSGSSPPNVFVTFSALAPVPAVLGFTVGMPVVAIERTDFLLGIVGVISAITSSTIVVQVLSTIGDITDPTAYTSWAISASGFKGTAGDPGDDGTSLRPRGEWGSGTAYVALDLVTRSGGSYTCTAAVGPTGTPPESDGSHWQLTASKGDPGSNGDDGASLNPRGGWSAGVAYAPLDLVTFDGSGYVCTVAVGPTATDPSADASHWMVDAAKGADGDTGPAGPPNPFVAGTLTSGTTPLLLDPAKRVVLAFGPGALTAQLPPISDATRYCEWEVVDANGTAGSGTITIAPDGTDTINGVNAPVTITTNWKRRIITGTGVGWAVSGEV